MQENTRKHPKTPAINSNNDNEKYVNRSAYVNLDSRGPGNTTCQLKKCWDLKYKDLEILEHWNLNTYHETGGEGVFGSTLKPTPGFAPAFWNLQAWENLENIRVLGTWAPVWIWTFSWCLGLGGSVWLLRAPIVLRPKTPEDLGILETWIRGLET